jgi:hypothetical protein
MLSSRSLTRRRHLVVCALASLAVSVAGSGAASAAEVAPQISLLNGIVVGSFSAPSLRDPSAPDFVCFVTSQDVAGNFTCSSSGSAAVSGQVVGLTNGFNVVVGHAIRMVRQGSSTTESFEGAITGTGAGSPFLWMAGVVERTTRTRECSRGRCLTVTRTVGPLPFTAEVFSLGG